MYKYSPEKKYIINILLHQKKNKVSYSDPILIIFHKKKSIYTLIIKKR